MFDLPDLPDAAVQPITTECVVEISEHYALHPDILWAILLVEQGQVGKEQRHPNGAVDIGPAQINTSHLDELEKLGITRQELRDNGCINLSVAAAYIRRVTRGQQMNTPENYLRALARYHNKQEPYNGIYVEKLRKAFQQLHQHDVQRTQSIQE